MVVALFWMMKRVPAYSEITAVTSRFEIAALNTPGMSGILVFSEICFNVSLISF